MPAETASSSHCLARIGTLVATPRLMHAGPLESNSQNQLQIRREQWAVYASCRPIELFLARWRRKTIPNPNPATPMHKRVQLAGSGTVGVQ